MMQNFALSKPMIQAPMAGVTSPKFVAACCDAGILGSIGAGYLNGAETKEFIQQVKALTDKRFCVNLFVQEEPKIDITVLQDARVALQPFYEKLGVSNTQRVISTEVFDGQVQAVIDEEVSICSFTFGIPSEAVISKLKAHGVYLIGTATTVEEAIAVEKAGLDAVVVQGSEAGGHRGSFTDPIKLIPTKQLLQDVLKNVSINCIAAGGIMTAEHVTEMLEIGATAVQIGTVLLTAHECEVSNVHKQAVLESEQKATTLTKAFTGKYARGLKTMNLQKSSRMRLSHPIPSSII
ncbi:MAG: nitronate monooxygenase [Solibacillus sp.]